MTEIEEPKKKRGRPKGSKNKSVNRDGRPPNDSITAARLNLPELHHDPKYQTLEGLKTHPLWPELPGQQQVFLEAYISSNRDAAAATRAAYPNTQEKNLRAMASQVLRKYRPRTLLTLFYGTEVSNTYVDKAELFGLLSRWLRAHRMSNGRHFVQIVALYARLRGWDKLETIDKIRHHKQIRKPADTTTESDTDIMSLVLAMEQQNEADEEEQD